MVKKWSYERGGLSWGENITILVHLKSGLIRWVAFSGSGLIKGRLLCTNLCMNLPSNFVCIDIEQTYITIIVQISLEY